MNTNYETDHERTPEVLADRELVGALGLLAASGVGAEVVYTGDADGCPYCALQVLSEAA